MACRPNRQAIGWVDIEPEEHTFIVNIGDIVQVWSNGRYKAAVHRVTAMYLRVLPDYPCRSSTCRRPMPSSNRLPLARTRNTASSPQDEFINKRIADNYEKVGDEDMQVSDYLIG